MISQRPTVIFGCNCDGFKKGNGVWFDSQDAMEGNWQRCPCCKKPFKGSAEEVPEGAMFMWDESESFGDVK